MFCLLGFPSHSTDRSGTKQTGMVEQLLLGVSSASVAKTKLGSWYITRCVARYGDISCVSLAQVFHSNTGVYQLHTWRLVSCHSDRRDAHADCKAHGKRTEGVHTCSLRWKVERLADGCARRNADPFHAPVKSVAVFLCMLHEKEKLTQNRAQCLVALAGPPHGLMGGRIFDSAY